jgi:hypothetical protein
MKPLNSRRGGRLAVAGWSRFVAALLASALAAACDHPFQPFEESTDAPFSIFGYLDLKADTQWVRVMPARQHLLLDPEPIDAVVTLEHLGSGDMVTLNDSLFSFEDRRLEGVAYAYNFWTTERLEPGATYRLRAVRSDGAASTAVVVMPPELEFSFLSDPRILHDAALLEVRAEHVMFVEVVYAMSYAVSGLPAPPIVIRSQHWNFPTDDPGTQSIGVRGDTLPPWQRQGLIDERRQEIRLTVGRSDWPYHPGLSDLEVTLPGKMPSNVENGVGFVGGVATWTFPFHTCHVLAERADRKHACALNFNAESGFIGGRVIQEPCGAPHVLEEIRLTEKFAGGGAVVRTWKTGWNGEYRFEGIEPGADLVLELNPAAPAVHLPRLGPGERYIVPEIPVPGGC